MPSTFATIIEEAVHCAVCKVTSDINNEPLVPQYFLSINELIGCGRNPEGWEGSDLGVWVVCQECHNECREACFKACVEEVCWQPIQQGSSAFRDGEEPLPREMPEHFLEAVKSRWVAQYGAELPLEGLMEHGSLDQMKLSEIGWQERPKSFGQACHFCDCVFNGANAAAWGGEWQCQICATEEDSDSDGDKCECCGGKEVVSGICPPYSMCLACFKKGVAAGVYGECCRLYNGSEDDHICNEEDVAASKAKDEADFNKFKEGR